jgi:hypothetical protein
LPRSGDGSNTDGRSGGVGKPARRLILAEEVNAYYEAQRRATRARLKSETGEFYHWAKVAAEVARIAPQAAMDVDVVREIVTEEERRRT